MFSADGQLRQLGVFILKARPSPGGLDRYWVETRYKDCAHTTAANRYGRVRASGYPEALPTEPDLWSHIRLLETESPACPIAVLLRRLTPQLSLWAMTMPWLRGRSHSTGPKSSPSSAQYAGLRPPFTAGQWLETQSRRFSADRAERTIFGRSPCYVITADANLSLFCTLSISLVAENGRPFSAPALTPAGLSAVVLNSSSCSSLLLSVVDFPPRALPLFIGTIPRSDFSRPFILGPFVPSNYRLRGGREISPGKVRRA